MNEFLRTKGVWIAIGVVCLGAAGFYAFPVRQKTREAAALREELRKRKQDLDGLKANTALPNEQWIEVARNSMETVRSSIEALENYFINQRRDCQSRRFYKDEQGENDQISDQYKWKVRYEEKCAELTKEIRAVSAREGGLLTFRNWGARLPPPNEITSAMMEFWLMKDMVGILANSEPKDLDDYMKRYEPAIGSGFDLVRNKNAEQPGVTLAELVKNNRLKPEQLRDVLKQMLSGPNGWDVCDVLSGCVLSPDAASSTPKQDTLWDALRAATTDPAQTAALQKLQGDDDWRNLYDFANDLKVVRFQADIAGLLENHGRENPRFESLVTLVKEMDPAEKQKLLLLIDRAENWSIEDIVGAVSCILSISSEDDYKLLVKNHGTPQVLVESLNLSGVRGAGMGLGLVASEGERERELSLDATAVARPQLGFPEEPGLYYTLAFDLSVRIEFRDVPALIRRLAKSDWCISIDVFQMQKSGASLDRRTADTATMSGRGGREIPIALPVMGPAGGVDGHLQVPRARMRTVSLVMHCEAKSFKLLKDAKESAKAMKEPEEGAGSDAGS